MKLRFVVAGNWDGNKIAVLVSKLTSELCDMEVCVREYLPNWRLIIPCSRYGLIWVSQLGSRRVHVDIALTLLVSIASNFVCAEIVEYETTQRVGLCLV